MSIARYNALVYNMSLDRVEMEDAGLDWNDVVSEAVPNMLAENAWIGEFLKDRDVIDVAGRLADDIVMECLIDPEDV